MERSLTEINTIRLMGEHEFVQVAIALMHAVKSQKRIVFFISPPPCAAKGKVNKFGSKRQ